MHINIEGRVREAIGESGAMSTFQLHKIVDEFDPIVHVNRNAIPKLHVGGFRLVNPELELIGPTEFDIMQSERWFHPQQIERGVPANHVFNKLQKDGLIERCFGLAELEAIKARGVHFFRKYFGVKRKWFVWNTWSADYLYAWKTIIVSTIDGWYKDQHQVPFLHAYREELTLYWHKVAELGLESGSPAMLHKKVLNS
jgi:hypothetical protein